MPFTYSPIPELLMKKFIFALTITTVLMAATQPLLAQKETDRQILLSGKDWQFREGPVPVANAIPADLAGGEWMSAEVPGNVQADLDDLEKLGAWTYGATDPRVYQPEKQNWWYQKSFTVPQTLQDRRLNLVFDGVDHHCEVWLNGKFLGSHAGMFRRFSFEVADKIRFDAPNELLVFIHRIPEGITDRGPWITKVWAELKDLKSLTSNAWDWTPNPLWSMGIWKNVSLEATGPARIEWVQVTTKLSKNSPRPMFPRAWKSTALPHSPPRRSFASKATARMREQSRPWS
jgi:beta-mannosidase